MTKQQKAERISIRLSPEQLAQLRAEAERRGLSASAVARWALAEWLAQQHVTTFTFPPPKH